MKAAQRGFAAIAAIFLVVVLAGLGGFMVSISNTAQLDSAKDIQGTRAYWAARAGLEWGLGAANAVALPANITAATCTSATPLAIDGFSVRVTCTPATYTEGDLRYIIKINAVATAGGAPGNIGYVERSVSAGLER
jgi:MSHA biogenesis protein MshP